MMRQIAIGPTQQLRRLFELRVFCKSSSFPFVSEMRGGVSASNWFEVQSGHAFDDDKPVQLTLLAPLLRGTDLKIEGSKGTEAARGQLTHCDHEFVISNEIECERWLIM
jgi:hypothetical protein